MHTRMNWTESYDGSCVMPEDLEVKEMWNVRSPYTQLPNRSKHPGRKDAKHSEKRVKRLEIG